MIWFFKSLKESIELPHPNLSGATTTAMNEYTKDQLLKAEHSDCGRMFGTQKHTTLVLHRRPFSLIADSDSASKTDLEPAFPTRLHQTLSCQTSRGRTRPQPIQSGCAGRYSPRWVRLGAPRGYLGGYTGANPGGYRTWGVPSPGGTMGGSPRIPPPIPPGVFP